MPLASKEHCNYKNVVRRGKEDREGWGRKEGRGEAYRLTAGLFLCGFSFFGDGGAAEGAFLGKSLIYERLIYKRKREEAGVMEGLLLHTFLAASFSTDFK